MSALSLSFAPLIGWPYLAGLAALGIVGVALALVARRPGALARAGALALALLALADPSLVSEDRAPLKDIVALIVDRSGSQTLADRAQQTEAARAELERKFGALDNVELRIAESERTDPEGTRLFARLSRALADIAPERLGAVVLLTDGLVHDIPDTIAALGLKAPIHALVTGHARERDRRIELTEAPRFGLVGKEAIFEAQVIDSSGDPAPVTLRVRRDGAEAQTLNVIPGARVSIPLRIEHGGPNVVEFEIETAPGELTALNNKAVATIEGVRDKLKVLLVSGEPHAGERAWRNLLRSDANVELVHFTILRPPEKQDGTPIQELALIAFPTHDLFQRKIKEFDLIIFDRYSNQSVLSPTYLDNIVKYVREGGALLIAAGPDFASPSGIFYSPLGAIAPGEPEGTRTERPFRARISEEGRKHPVTRDLPGGASDPPQWSEWFRQVNARVTRGVSVLQGADDKPLLILSREGKGRVAELLTDQTWLWARGFQGGGPHVDLTRRLAHWLMKEPDLEEEALRARAQGRQIRIERQTLKDVIGPARLTTPSGAVRDVALTPESPGLSRASVEADELGLHKVQSGDLTRLVSVGVENPREFHDVVSSTEPLRALVEASGGTIRRVEAPGEGAVATPRVASVRDSSVYGGADWIGVRRTNAHVVRAIGVAPLALGLAALIVLLCGFLTTWFAEGRRTSKDARP